MRRRSLLFSVCKDSLGMEDGDIPDENIRASSQITTFDLFAWMGRLNGNATWSAARSDSQPWIQADIGYQTNISGVVTQGDGGVGGDSTPDWVTTLKVSTFVTGPSGVDEEIFVKNENGEVMVNISFECLYFFVKQKQAQRFTF